MLHKEPSCNLIDDKDSWNAKYDRYDLKICLTHEITVCRCGYKYGAHFDTDSVAIYRATLTHPQLYDKAIKNHNPEQIIRSQASLTSDSEE